MPKFGEKNERTAETPTVNHDFPSFFLIILVHIRSIQQFKRNEIKDW